MKQGKKITKEQADKIIINWQNGNNPLCRVVCVWRGQWYDLRELSDPVEIDQFLTQLSGIKPTKENTMNIDL